MFLELTRFLLILRYTNSRGTCIDGDGYKFITCLDSCDLKQLVNQPTHLHSHILDLILSPSDQDTIIDVKICDFVSDHALVKSSMASSSSSYSKKSSI